MQTITVNLEKTKPQFCCILQCIHMHGHPGINKRRNNFIVKAKYHYFSTANLRKNQAMMKGCFRLIQSEDLTIRQSQKLEKSVSRNGNKISVRKNGWCLEDTVWHRSVQSFPTLKFRAECIIPTSPSWCVMHRQVFETATWEINCRLPIKKYSICFLPIQPSTLHFLHFSLIFISTP